MYETNLHTEEVEKKSLLAYGNAEAIGFINTPENRKTLEAKRTILQEKLRRVEQFLSSPENSEKRDKFTKKHENKELAMYIERFIFCLLQIRILDQLLRTGEIQHEDYMMNTSSELLRQDELNKTATYKTARAELLNGKTSFKSYAEQAWGQLLVELTYDSSKKLYR